MTGRAVEYLATTWRLLVLELGVDDVVVLRRFATTAAGVTTSAAGVAARLLVHRLGELVRRGLELLERTAQLVGVAALAVTLEHLFGLLERFLDLELVGVAELGRVLADELLRAVDQRVELVAGLD